MYVCIYLFLFDSGIYLKIANWVWIFTYHTDHEINGKKKRQDGINPVCENSNYKFSLSFPKCRNLWDEMMPRLIRTTMSTTTLFSSPFALKNPSSRFSSTSTSTLFNGTRFLTSPLRSHAVSLRCYASSPSAFDRVPVLNPVVEMDGMVSCF